MWVITNEKAGQVTACADDSNWFIINSFSYFYFQRLQNKTLKPTLVSLFTCHSGLCCVGWVVFEEVMPGVSVWRRWKLWPFCFILVFFPVWGGALLQSALMRILVVSWRLIVCAALWLSRPQSSIFLCCDSQLIEDDLIDNDSADSSGPFPLFLSPLPCSPPPPPPCINPFSYMTNIVSTPNPAGLSLWLPSHLCFSLSLHEHNHCHKLVIWQEMAISVARLGLWCC